MYAFVSVLVQINTKQTIGKANGYHNIKYLPFYSHHNYSKHKYSPKKQVIRKNMVFKLLFNFMKKPIMSSLRTRFGSVLSASETKWEHYNLKKTVFHLVKDLFNNKKRSKTVLMLKMLNIEYMC